MTKNRIPCCTRQSWKSPDWGGGRGSGRPRTLGARRPPSPAAAGCCAKGRGGRSAKNPALIKGVRSSSEYHRLLTNSSVLCPRQTQMCWGYGRREATLPHPLHHPPSTPNSGLSKEGGYAMTLADIGGITFLPPPPPLWRPKSVVFGQTGLKSSGRKVAIPRTSLRGSLGQVRTIRGAVLTTRGIMQGGYTQKGSVAIKSSRDITAKLLAILKGGSSQKVADARPRRGRDPPLFWDHRPCPRHARAMPAPCPRHARAMPAPCPRHARAKPAPSPRQARAVPAPCPRQARAKPPAPRPHQCPVTPVLGAVASAAPRGWEGGDVLVAVLGPCPHPRPCKIRTHASPEPPPARPAAHLPPRAPAAPRWGGRGGGGSERHFTDCGCWSYFVHCPTVGNIEMPPHLVFSND
eukprot:gene14203-biopygen3578